MATNLADQLTELSAQLARTADAIRDGTASLETDTQERAKVAKAAREILDLVKQPQDDAMGWWVALSRLTALRIFIKWGVFQHIPVSDTISYADLAAKVDADPSLLARLVWNLIPGGILKQVGTDRITHTPKSEIYSTKNPLSAMACFTFDNIMPSLAHMPKFFDTHPRRETNDRLNTIASHALGMPGKTIWDIMTRDPEQVTNFALAMNDKTRTWPDLGSYDIKWAVESGNSEKNKDRAILVDVGGGKGQAIKAIVKATPGLDPGRCVLQDLPEIIGEVKGSPDPELAGAQLVGLDFHKEQPIRGGLVYYLRRCLHDYGDEDCVGILTQISSAMEPDSRLLIVEALQGNPPSTVAAGMDMLMITIGGKERTLDGFRAITSPAGLEIIRTYTEPGVEGAVIECARKTASSGNSE